MYEVVANDYVYREPTMGERRGKAAAREVVTMYRNAFPHIKLTIDEQTSRGRQGRDADERQRNPSR